jgi:HEAT repeats
MMKNTANITGAGNKSTQVGTTPREKNPVSTFNLIVLGGSLFVLVAVTIALYQNRATGENGLLAYLLGLLAIAVFIWLSTQFALRTRPKKVKPTQHDKVLAALISTILDRSSDPNARLAAVKGLSELDLEESAGHIKHDDIDAILISVLQTDTDSRVRTAAAEGLSVVELEKGSYYHTHDQLYSTLLKHGIAD